ncbi:MULTISPECIES: GntR family transcriptional regulator [unclassified Streptomyces]|uniref:GntR family transcriptional regulator n=1 Tax=unclassified Streptomyces TaxID=2593676 RepID=UPI00081B1A81|nr:GntR family transcriptional regulator [Streptomyces sp. BvitLS-983]MYX88449.1 GntR family transcriptional regulator [Streptomyces sp. SID4915]SCE16861.1 GIY-YIG catalytic domain-containing protein [Streptomyces sp. BvitLS-983]
MPSVYYEFPDDIAVCSDPIRGYLYSETPDERGIYRIIGTAPPPPSKVEEEATGLYRLFGSDERLLYVGVSNNPGVRWAQHSEEKEWWDQVDNHTVHWFRSRLEAETAERVAIEVERPLYNHLHAAPDAFTQDWWTSARLDRRAKLSLSRQIAQIISTAIEDGLLPLGSRLLTISRMAHHLGVSTSVVGIAMRQLRDKGVITSQQGVALYVAS